MSGTRILHGTAIALRDESEHCKGCMRRMAANKREQALIHQGKGCAAFRKVVSEAQDYETARAEIFHLTPLELFDWPRKR